MYLTLVQRRYEAVLRKEYYHRNKPLYDKLMPIVQQKILDDGGSLGDLSTWEMTE